MDKAITKLTVPNTQVQDYDLAGIHNEIKPKLINLIKEGVLNPKPLMVCSGGTSTQCGSQNHWSLDLRQRYKSITFEPFSNEVVIEGGVKMQELINKISKSSRTFPIGLSGLTGIGYILTGGISPLSRKYGLAIDNILEIKGLWGNGSEFIIRKPIANSSENEKYLWRALCGAAPFLAIVTSIRLKTYKSKSIYVWESLLEPNQLADVIIKAEEWPVNGSLYWSWQERIKVCGIFEIEDIDNTKEIEMLIAELPETTSSKKYIVSNVLEIPSLSTIQKYSKTTKKKYSEVLGILGNKWKDNSFEIVNKIKYLMNSRPDSSCSISVQQLGGYVSTIPKDMTSFIHRDAVWKPWITASWEASDNYAKTRSLKWLENTWKELEPICPGVHLAQFHYHLPWHKKETNAAFQDWITNLQKLKSIYDPNGNLPPI